MDKEKLYKQLIEAYTEAYPEKDGKAVQMEVSVVWKEMKADTENFLQKVKSKMQEWKAVTMREGKTILAFWGQVRDILNKNMTLSQKKNSNSRVQ